MEPGHDLHRPAAGTRSPDVAGQVFDALVSQTAVGFALLDADLRYVTLNERLAEIKVELDRQWDLLRQREAHEEFQLDPENTSVRDEGTVEGYEQ